MTARKDSEALRRKLAALIQNFEEELKAPELRQKVRSLVPIFRELRNLGKSLLPAEAGTAARNRILYYFQKYPLEVIEGNELLVVSGIQEYARRVRELRVEFGWQIASGVTIEEMLKEGEEASAELRAMKSDDYILLNPEQDKEAAHRWNVANEIRKSPGAVRDKILRFLQENVGQPVTLEELKYIAKNKSEWARRVRELRTECGWPVVTRNTGAPTLKVGEYMLESLRQSPEHDRRIPDDVRREVLRRDDYRCRRCGWTHDDWNRSDPRHLELHHIQEHAQGGKNTAENLMTVCTVCHDKIHSGPKEDKRASPPSV